MKKTASIIFVYFLLLSQLFAQDSSGQFEIRGVLPWHNFLSGPSAWNLKDYRQYLDECKKQGINFIAFHNYTGGGERYVTYVEPMICIAWRNIVPDAYFDNSGTTRWGYYPLKVNDFAYGTDERFDLTAGAEVFGADCSVLSSTREEHYTRSQALMQQVIQMAHERGMQVAMGFEFGVNPPEYYSVKLYGSPHFFWNGASSMIPDPTSPEARELLYTTIDNLMETYRDLDWIWLWLNEHTMFGVNAAAAIREERFSKIFERDKTYFSESTLETQFLGVWSLEYLRMAYNYIKKKNPQVRVCLSGWGGGDQLPPILAGLDKSLPKDIVFSCLNPGQGQGFHMPVLAKIAKDRKVIAIPWLEGDESLWHYQPRAFKIVNQVRKAYQDRFAGVVCIHWRTEETKINMKMFSSEAMRISPAKATESKFRKILAEEYGDQAVQIIGSCFYQIDTAQWLKPLRSPEYAAYEPYWGQMDGQLRKRIESFLDLIRQAETVTKEMEFNHNLKWLETEMNYTLLLDQVGKKMEKAYRLKQSILMGEVKDENLPVLKSDAVHDLNEAPVEELFKVYASKVRSRGELGVLSSLNQKLWVQYLELERYFGLSSAK